MLRYVLVLCIHLIMFKIFVPGLYLWFSCYRYQYCNIKLNRKEQGKTIMNKNILHISICQTINRKEGERKLLTYFVQQCKMYMNYIWIKLSKKKSCKCFSKSSYTSCRTVGILTRFFFSNHVSFTQPVHTCVNAWCLKKLLFIKTKLLCNQSLKMYCMLVWTNKSKRTANCIYTL